MSHREFHAQFPCTPTEAKRIRSKSPDSYGPHPLEGKSVAEWVAEARSGWPKVPPVPKDPVRAACKLTDPAKTKDRPEWDTPTLEFDQ